MKYLMIRIKFCPTTVQLVTILILVLIVTSCSPSTQKVVTYQSIYTISPFQSSMTTEPTETKVVLRGITTLSVTNTHQPRIPTATKTATPTPTYLIFPGFVGFEPSPTYNPKKMPTATPAASPTCPKVDSSLAVPIGLAEMIKNYETNSDRTNLAEPILGFLNQGGSPEKIIQAWQEVNPKRIRYLDLTNDGQPEIILDTKLLSVLGCYSGSNGHYEIISKYADNIYLLSPELFPIQDINLDGIPELIMISRAFGFMSATQYLQVVEWDGKTFSNIISSPPLYPYRSLANTWYREVYSSESGMYFEPGSVELQDIDHNGTLEIIINISIPFHPDSRSHGPWRGGRDIFTWNGEAFVLLKSEIDPPEYRFQAVEDADQDVLIGLYDQALSLYQEAIFSDQLKGWSSELYQQQFEQPYLSLDPTLTPIPAPSEEYYHLAAYASFRLMVLHVLLGHGEEAQTIHDSLVAKFPEDQPGHESATLATSFWQEYQSTKEVGKACNIAIINSPDQVTEILSWLSYDWHGWQAPRYQPVDLCPFGQTSEHSN
jgi:hypothetical protein